MSFGLLLRRRSDGGGVSCLRAHRGGLYSRAVTRSRNARLASVSDPTLLHLSAAREYRISLDLVATSKEAERAGWHGRTTRRREWRRLVLRSRTPASAPDFHGPLSHVSSPKHRSHEACSAHPR